ncbi:MAG: GNAT family N-acetyltransferase [Nocardioidaceae bacterium]
MEVRTANPEDWPEIWPFFHQVVEAGETYAYAPGLTSEEASRMWLQPAPSHAAVAVEHGRILGTATMGPNRPGRGSHIGTASFVVDPAVRRRGVGLALGEYVVDWHRRRGYQGIQFNAVVETNLAALELWRRLGFTVVGTIPGAFDHATKGYVGLCVMFLPLG